MNAPVDPDVRAEAEANSTPTASRPRRDDVSAIIESLHVISREIRHAGEEAEHRTGLTAAQLGILHQIVAAGPMSVTELAARAHKDVSTVSVVARYLVDDEFLDREILGDNRGRQVLMLTARGRAAARRASEPEGALINRAAFGLSAAEVKRLANGMSKLVRQLARPRTRSRMRSKDVRKPSR